MDKKNLIDSISFLNLKDNEFTINIRKIVERVESDDISMLSEEIMHANYNEEVKFKLFFLLTDALKNICFLYA